MMPHVQPDLGPALLHLFIGRPPRLRPQPEPAAFRAIDWFNIGGGLLTTASAIFAAVFGRKDFIRTAGMAGLAVNGSATLASIWNAQHCPEQFVLRTSDREPKWNYQPGTPLHVVERSVNGVRMGAMYVWRCALITGLLASMAAHVKLPVASLSIGKTAIVTSASAVGMLTLIYYVTRQKDTNPEYDLAERQCCNRCVRRYWELYDQGSRLMIALPAALLLTRLIIPVYSIFRSS